MNEDHRDRFYLKNFYFFQNGFSNSENIKNFHPTIDDLSDKFGET